jgi:hypothetical protein
MSVIKTRPISITFCLVAPDTANVSALYEAIVCIAYLHIAHVYVGSEAKTKVLSTAKTPIDNALLTLNGRIGEFTSGSRWAGACELMRVKWCEECRVDPLNRKDLDYGLG